MKNSVLKRVLGTALAGFMAVTSVPFAAKELTADAAKTLTTSPQHTQETGWYNDYHHEIWQADTPNSSTMILNDDDGGFSTTWKCGPNNSKGNFLARRGLFYGLDNPHTWQDYGGFTCDFDCSWSAGNTGNSRICIYGWTQNPLVEYYIIEDWKNWCPSKNDYGASYKGTAEIDGSTYDIFTEPRDSYTIEGNKPFTQYFSVRRDTRTSGTISIGEHFKAWEGFGMKMGNFYEVAFNIEGWESDGQGSVKCTIKEGSNPEPQKEVEPDENGDYIKNTFEDGAGDFKGRGDASVKNDSDNYYSGSKSLFVSGRTDNWNGAEMSLSSSTFKPGNTYSFSTGVLQNSGSSVDMKFTLQYTSGGEEKYMEVASATAASGEWTKLENKEFTIPTGASSMKLYVEAPESLTDFYIDDVYLSKEGKASAVVNGGGTVKGGKQTPGSSTTTTTVTTNKITNIVNGSGIAAHQNNDYSYDANGTGFKDYMGKYFRLGTCVNAWNIQKQDVQSFIKKNFNSITCENEMKPSDICVQSQSSGDNIAISLQKADPILKFCEQNGIGLRGHTFVWYSQTPEWIFKENMQSNSGGFVSPERMNKRLESMIKNTFDALKTNYPNLKIYSYDVCNELFKNDGGGFRGDGSESSNWWTVYHNDSFVINAFKYARQYAPAGCKLYMNDYNEYFVAKREDLYNMAKKILAEGDYIDGIGMQSHMHYDDFGGTGSATKSTNSKFGTYADAIDLFNSLGLDVQITELDVTNCANQKGADLYVDIFKVAMERGLNISSLTLWGHCDSASWRNDYQDGGKPLPFDANCQPKSFYNDIIALSGKITPGPIDVTTTTTTTTVTTTTTTIVTLPEPDLYGDANCDNEVNMADAVFIMQSINNPDKYKLTANGENNADVFNRGDGITNKDALSIQKYKLGIISSLPESVGTAQKKTDVTTTTVTTAKPTTTTTTVTAAPANYFTSKFDTTGNWLGRGDASVSIDKDSYYSEGGSLKVTGRSKNWNGASITLDSSFKAGSTYSFSAAVLQKVSDSDDFKISLQYNDASGTQSFDTIAEASAKKNTWTKIENTEYTLPAGATDMIVYVETADSTISFNVDDFAIQEKGKASAVVTGQGTVTEETFNIDPSKPMIAISFDDGCSPANNKRIVDALTEQGFHATFFYVSNWSQGAENQAEIKYAYSKGMEIANHTVSHPYLGQKSASEIRQEADGCHNYLKSVLGVEPSKLLRLPYLDQGGAVKSTLTDYGLVTDAIDTEDYKDQTTTAQIVQKIKNAMADGSGNGAVVLCHETYSKTAAAIEELAPYIKAQGWQIVTITEMFEAKGKAIPYGQIITRV